MNLLAVEDLRVAYRTGASAPMTVLDGVDFALDAGEALALVGESGSGKSQTALAVMGLLPAGVSTGGSIRYAGEQLLGAARARYDTLRGSQIGMVFQDPMSSLNPYRRVGAQLAEGLIRHRRLSADAAARECLRLLDAVRIAAPRRCLTQYPHELSGGMRQRVVIAMALACRPQLLIADEPTTALDVTVQAEVLDVLGEWRREHGLALLLITHDLGVVARHCERVAVMYAGRVIESGPVPEVLGQPAHPYTAALLAARPSLSGPRPRRLATIAGQPPDPARRPTGCAFAPRCGAVVAACQQRPVLFDFAADRQCACVHVSRRGDGPVKRADDRRDAPL